MKIVISECYLESYEILYQVVFFRLYTRALFVLPLENIQESPFPNGALYNYTKIYNTYTRFGNEKTS